MCPSSALPPLAAGAPHDGSDGAAASCAGRPGKSGGWSKAKSNEELCSCHPDVLLKRFFIALSIFPSYLPEYLVTSNLLLLQWTGVKFPSFEAGRTKENSFFLPNFSLLSGEFCYISISHLKLKCSGPAAVLCGLSKVSNVMFIITCTVKRAHRPQQLLFPFYFSYLLSSGKAKNGEKCEICQGCCLAVQNMDSLSVLICSLQSP